MFILCYTDKNWVNVWESFASDDEAFIRVSEIEDNLKVPPGVLDYYLFETCDAKSLHEEDMTELLVNCIKAGADIKTMTKDEIEILKNNCSENWVNAMFAGIT